MKALLAATIACFLNTAHTFSETTSFPGVRMPNTREEDSHFEAYEHLRSLKTEVDSRLVQLSEIGVSLRERAGRIQAAFEIAHDVQSKYFDQPTIPKTEATLRLEGVQIAELKEQLKEAEQSASMNKKIVDLLYTKQSIVSRMIEERDSGALTGDALQEATKLAELILARHNRYLQNAEAVRSLQRALTEHTEGLLDHRESLERDRRRQQRMGDRESLWTNRRGVSRDDPELAKERNSLAIAVLRQMEAEQAAMTRSLQTLIFEKFEYEDTVLDCRWWARNCLQYILGAPNDSM